MELAYNMKLINIINLQTWGVSSTVSSPFRYCWTNSEFSPTYEPITLDIFFCFNNFPRPKLSTPALLLITVKSFISSRSTKPSISFSGIPQRPKPIIIKKIKNKHI